jgi:anti-sigma-K factor RskA
LSSCDQFRELYEAYALGALDAAERSEFEAHLATDCQECAKGVAEARWVVSQLAFMSPDAAPSDMLKGRLMQTVRAEAKGPASVVPGAASVTKQAIPLWMWAGVAALLLVALYAGWNARQVGQDLDAQRQTTAQLQQSNTDARQKLAAMEVQLATMKRETAILSDPGAKKITMAPQKIQAPDLVALWQQDGIVVTGAKLPMPGGNHVLQLWMIPKDPAGKPIPSVSLRPDANGRLVMVVAHPPDPSSVKALAITEEPEGGSPQPTSPPRWVGAMT